MHVRSPVCVGEALVAVKVEPGSIMIMDLPLSVDDKCLHSPLCVREALAFKVEPGSVMDLPLSVDGKLR
jgi:hypothetical protein